MAGQIIIPLSGSDRLEEVLPYLERVAQPEMKAVFLIHVGLSHFEEIANQLLTIDTGLGSGFLLGRNNGDELVKQQIRLAEEKIFPACAALRARGMEIRVSVFAGSVRKAVRDYALKEEVHLVMMRVEGGNWFTRTLRHVVSHLARFRAQTLPPVLLFHPSSIIGGFNERAR